MVRASKPRLIAGARRLRLEFVQQNPQMRQQIQAPLFEDKVVDHIFENATVSEKKASKADLEKAVEALEDE